MFKKPMQNRNRFTIEFVTFNVFYYEFECYFVVVVVIMYGIKLIVIIHGSKNIVVRTFMDSMSQK